MPWWLLDVSMAAYTFAVNTTNQVKGIIKENDVAKNRVLRSCQISDIVTVSISASSAIAPDQ
jgi:hypothetical protein